MHIIYQKQITNFVVTLDRLSTPFIILVNNNKNIELEINMILHIYGEIT